MPQLECFIKGMRRLSSGHAQARLTVTPGILCGLQSSWETCDGHCDGAMLWAVACMCFFSLLRSEEVVVRSELAYDNAMW